MKPIRVALSGSGFKFPAHVGALLAIRDAGFEIVEIAGTSGGSIIAALFACGMPLDQMRTLSLQHDWSGMLSLSPWTVITKGSYCSGDALLKWLEQNTAGKTFADLSIPLTIMASDVSAMLPFEFSIEETVDASIALAARASASIPVAYSPVQYRGAVLQDGGMCNNIPVDKLTVDGIPRLGIQLVSKSSPLLPGTHSMIEIIGRDMDLMLQASENTHIDLAVAGGAHIAFVETGYASGLDRNMAGNIRMRLLNDGYDSTAAALVGIGVSHGAVAA